MNFGSSVLHIVVEPATDCCRKVGAEDTIEHLLMVLIVECSCQIERDGHCSVAGFFLWKPEAMSAVIVDSAVHVEYFDRFHVEQGGKGCESVFMAAVVLSAF